MNGEQRTSFLLLVVIGAGAGMLSGLFGIGGGLVIVPALVGMAKFPHRLAAGTSVAAILPAAVVGSLSYAIQGNVDWIAAGMLALGVVVGAQIGSRLLVSLPLTLIRVLFLVFVAIVIVSLWIMVPSRDDTIEISALTGIGLILTGAITGVLSGVLGVGGGVIVVPVLILVFGASDLIAKGSSLLMMVPGSVSGTISNVRRHNVDLRAGLLVGLTACLTAPLGVTLASRIHPQLANIVFSLFLVFIIIQMFMRMWQGRTGGTNR